MHLHPGAPARPMRPTLLALAFACVLLAPTTVNAAPAAAPAAHHWALAWGRAQTEDAPAAPHSELACALGDLDADGVQDVLLRARDDADAKLSALSAATGNPLWEQEIEPDAALACAPDVAGDGAADPLVLLDERAPGAIPDGAPVTAEDANARLRALDGATGDALLTLEAAKRTTGGEAGPVAGASRVDASLSPGGKGIYVFAKVEKRSTTSALLDELALSSDATSVELQVLDAKGSVLGTIKSAPGADVLAHAVVSDGNATVLVLSATEASPIDQAPARVPSVSAFEVDGTLRWSVELPSRTDALMLLPDAGDLDADGVTDLVVQTAPAPIGLPDASSLAVLSGATGEILLERASDEGLLAALPLGDVTPDGVADGDALLVITQAAEDAPILLECVRSGATCWTAELPAGAIPVNADTDEFTGDIGGFEDLTGDGVPDVCALVEEGDLATLRALDGTDGALAWTAKIEEAASVVAIPRTEGADLVVLSALDGATRGLGLSLLDGATGGTLWSAIARVPAGTQDVHAHVAAAASGESLLLTVGTEHAWLLLTATGATTWTGSGTIGAEAPEALEIASVASGTSGIAQIPAVGLGLAVAVLAVGALARRRA